MTIRLLDLPLESKDWPPWLEQMIVSTDLGRLVLELQTVAEGTSPSIVSLQQVLGEHRQRVLDTGLSCLSENELSSLLQNPSLLLELQELVLIEGGEHWLRLSQSADHAEQARSDAKRVATQFDTESEQASDPVSRAANNDRNPSGGGGKFLLAIMALAAAVLVVIAVQNGKVDPVDTEDPLWGFDRSGLLTASVPPKEYYQSLSEAAQEWFNEQKRPQSKDELLVRLEQFSHGCETLIDAPHEQLVADHRQILIDRCRDCKTDIDLCIAGLRDGTLRYEDALEKADNSVERLVDSFGNWAYLGGPQAA